jgi:hypothetical protein
MYFEVVCQNGRVTFEAGKGVGIVTVVKAGEEHPVVREFDSTLNTQYEVAAFMKSIQQGKREVEMSPERALDDLVFMQPMLESGREGGVVKSLEFAT